MKNSNLKSIFDQTGQKKIENNLGKGLFKKNSPPSATMVRLPGKGKKGWGGGGKGKRGGGGKRGREVGGGILTMVK